MKRERDILLSGPRSNLNWKPMLLLVKESHAKEVLDKQLADLKEKK